METVAGYTTKTGKQGPVRFGEDPLSMLVHDLRSPVLMVLQSLDLVVQGIYGALAARPRQVLSELRDSCELLVSFIDDVLDVGRSEAGGLILKKTLTNLSRLIHESIALLQCAAEDKDVAVEIDIDRDVPHSIALDNKRIMRVLINLLDNAIRFSPRGEKVVVSCRNLSGREVLVSVADAGPGIAPEHHQHIFDKLYQIEVMKRPGAVGAGFGLAFCQVTVHTHGGEIWVESPLDDRGRGSRFSFTLPRDLSVEIL